MSSSLKCKRVLITAMMVSIFCLLFLGEVAWADAVNVVWERAFGGVESDYAIDVDVTFDGGFVLCGGTYSYGAGSADVYLVRTDSVGNKIWDANFGGSEVEVARSIRQTSDGCFIMAGNTASFGSGDIDIYLIKTDSSGNELWHKTFDEQLKDIGNCVREVSDGGFIIAGETACGSPSFDNDVYLMKTDASGNKQWSKTFGNSSTYERAHHIEQTSDGGFIMAGYRSSGTSDFYVIKTDSDGNSVWSRTYGGSSYDNAYCVRETSDGGFIIGGGSKSFSEDWDIYVVKTDSDGNTIWSRNYDPGSCCFGVLETTNGDFVLCGDSAGEAICMKIDCFGDVIWSKTLSNGEIGYEVLPAGVNAFVVGGRTSTIGAGSADMYLAKLIEPLGDTPLISEQPEQVEFAGFTDGNNPAPQSLYIYNTGTDELNWQISEGCDWLTAEPNSGSSTGEINEVNLSVDITGLGPGVYNCELTISDPNASNNPQVVTVSLNIYLQGQAYGWGLNDFGQATAPEGEDFIAIVAGYKHSLALKSDGSIVGWGYNDYGQATAPEGEDFIAIAAGGFHGLALKSDGSIVGWGQDDYGQATAPEGEDFIAIAAGKWHSLALKTDGSIVGWGYYFNGEATPPDGNDFVAVAAGNHHSLALKSDGSIVGWGKDEYGEATPPEGAGFIAISGGYSHSLALKSDGSIIGWGWDMYGQAAPPDGNDYVAIAAGWYHSVALKSDGYIAGWGNNNYGQATSPEEEDFIAIAAGGSHSLAIRYSPVGDLNNDRWVDMVDFAVLGEAWMSEIGDLNWDPACNISEPNDNVIDGLDLRVFVGNWLEGL